MDIYGVFNIRMMMLNIYGVLNIRMMGLLACWVLEQLYPEKATKRPTDWWIFRVTGRGTV